MPAPYIPVPNVASVEMIFVQSLQRIENVFHVSDTAGWTPTKMTTLAGVFRTWWDAQLKTFVPAACALTLIRVKDLTSAGAPGIEYSTGLPLAGTSVNPAAPLNVTIAVKWSTGLAGRSYRGRTYHIGFTTGSLANSVMSNADVATYTAAYTALKTNVNAGTQLMVVVSKFNSGSPRLTGVATPILACSIDPTGDSQRRRLPGRGD